jgi:hypothetical protein
MTDSTFTFGMTPESVVREAFARECPDGTFAVVARGIDAVSLEAAGCCDGDWSADELVEAIAALAAVDDGVHDGAHELAEYYTADEIIENAVSLRTDILSVLGIEEI